MLDSARKKYKTNRADQQALVHDVSAFLELSNKKVFPNYNCDLAVVSCSVFHC